MAIPPNCGRIVPFVKLNRIARILLSDYSCNSKLLKRSKRASLSMTGKIPCFFALHDGGLLEAKAASASPVLRVVGGNLYFDDPGVRAALIGAFERDLAALLSPRAATTAR